ncbi:MAG: hypothetical protein ABIH82_02105 [Candidatus Woesearchaeota archaeon]
MANTVKKMAWKFPLPDSFIFRIEAAFVAVLALLIFIGTLFYYNKQVLFPILFTLMFLVLYVLSAHIIRIVRQAEEHYLAHSTHLEITKKTRNKSSKVKVPWNMINLHKFDKFFLGGYLLTKDKKRHPLFFNTKKELEKFEDFVKKAVKIKK